MFSDIARINELLNKIQTAPLTQMESSEAACRIEEILELSDEDHSSELHHWMFLLGKGRAITYKHLIEKLLHYQKNEWVCAEALRILCHEWDFSLSYANDLAAFLQGVSWDLSGDLLLTAIFFTGECLKKEFQPSLAAHLIEIIDDQQRYSIEQKVCAYKALARASGKSWNEIEENSVIEKAFLDNQPMLIDLKILPPLKEALFAAKAECHC